MSDSRASESNEIQADNAVGSMGKDQAFKADPTTLNPDNPSEPTAKKPSAGHLLYALEMLIFALIGWAWLALRELMGNTPVIDVTVLLSLLVFSVLNLVFALVYYKTDQFKNFAQAFLNITVCILLLYVNGLAESNTDGTGSICCVTDTQAQSSTFSLRLTYKAAFFGGLTLHQPAAAITLSFLFIFLILASAQCRVCNENPREWPSRKLPMAVITLLCSQQAMFGLGPLCKDKDIAAAVISMVVMALISMVDVAWVYEKVFGDESFMASGVRVVSVVRLLQEILGVFFALLIGALTAVHVVNLGGGSALLIIVAAAFLWQALLVLSAVLEIINPRTASDEAGDADVDAKNSADNNNQEISQQGAGIGTGAHFRYPHQPMLLPGVRELRRNREKKAW
jgi:hypothetical protein